jgi:MT0933-like antitoxin protein
VATVAKGLPGADDGQASGESRRPARPDSKGHDMAGLGDKAKEFLDSAKGEQVSDQGLDKAEQFADERTGGTHDAQIDKARDFADDRIGQQGTEEPAP